MQPEPAANILFPASGFLVYVESFAILAVSVRSMKTIAWGRQSNIREIKKKNKSFCWFIILFIKMVPLWWLCWYYISVAMLASPFTCSEQGLVGIAGTTPCPLCFGGWFSGDGFRTTPVLGRNKCNVRKGRNSPCRIKNYSGCTHECPPLTELPQDSVSKLWARHQLSSHFWQTNILTMLSCKKLLRIRATS